MKRSLLLVALAALAFACSPEPQPSKPSNPTQPSTPQEPETVNYTFSASPASLSFTSDGGSQSFKLTTEAAWVGNTSESWISFQQKTGKGPADVTVTIGVNPDPDRERTGSITFKPSDKNATGSVTVTITQDREQRVPDPEPSVSVNVTTGAATKITSTTANITCNYSGAPSGGVYDRGVYYGTSQSAMNQQAALSSTSSTSGYFTVVLSSLEPGTTYYYKAYVTAWDESLGKFVDFFGSVSSFTTEGGGAVNGLQYLGGYEIPAINLTNTNACNNSGDEKSGHGYLWFNYLTTNDNQMVVTHTYKYNGKQYRNFTCLVDKTKKAPLWSAFVMHNEAYPDNNIGGRLGSFTNNWDPGIPSTWQQESSANGYSRGHFVASNYRQVCPDANKQTFYATNQALQQQNGFNGAIWEKLEQKVKSSAPSGRDTLYVVVGILYESGVPLPDFGSLPCPSHFYKLLMKCSFNASGTMTAAKGCAYLFENVSHGNSSSDYDNAKYRTTIDAIEQRSGWDFFTNVPQSLQDTAERQSSAVW